MSSDEEDEEGGFGADEFSEEEVFSESEDEDGGFGDDIDDDDEEDIGFGGNVDEDDDDDDEEENTSGFAENDGGDEVDEEDKAETVATPSFDAWTKYAKSNFAEGCAIHYEHPGLTKVWSDPITQLTGPIQKVQATISYKALLRFMGDLPDDKTKKTVHEQIEILCKEGIKDPLMSKELYCQVLKQLHQNTSKLSHARGFILLNMYLGSFMPPLDLFASIEEAISVGPAVFKQFSQQRASLLQSRNQSRAYPPLRIELLSVKQRSPVPLRVSVFKDALPVNMEVESLTTASEFTEAAANEFGIGDHEGFGVRIRAGVSITGLGDGKHYVLDVLSDLDKNAGEGKWRLQFAKQEFAPWHSRLQGRGLDLAASQVFHAIASGKLRLPDVSAYVNAVSLRYYVEYGEELIQGADLEKYVLKCLPNFLVEGQIKPDRKSSVKKKKLVQKQSAWAAEVDKTHARLEVTKTSAPKDVAQLMLIEIAQTNWPHFFSSFFAASLESKPALDFKQVTLAINEKGIFFLLRTAVYPFQHFAWSTISHVLQSPIGHFDMKVEETEGNRAWHYSFGVHNQEAIVGSMVKLSLRLKQQSQ